MSGCDHVWRAIASNSSQCRKCGECVTKPPTMQPQSVTWGILQERIAELERQLETIRNDTLEEAAGVCMGLPTSYPDDLWTKISGLTKESCADAIRKMKREE